MSTPNLPLSGVRVVEMTHMVMGPTCGMILAQLGAEVIKVEPPAGDKTRSLGGMGTSFFPLFNRGKRSVVLDFAKAEAGKFGLCWEVVDLHEVIGTLGGDAAVVAERKLHCPPCGGCRQRLAEFGSADTPVHLGRPGNAPHSVTLGELLPLSFGREDLET